MAARYSWRMKGVGASCAASSAFHAAASTSRRRAQHPGDIIVRVVFHCCHGPQNLHCPAQLHGGRHGRATRKRSSPRRAPPTRRARAWCSRRSCPSAAMPAEDLFLRPAFIAACDDAVKTVARELAGLKGLHVVVGHPHGRRHPQQVGAGAAALQRRQRAERRPGARNLRQARAAQLPGVRRAPLLHARAGHLRVPGRRRQRRPADLRGRLVRRAGAAGQESGAQLLAVHQRLAVPRRQGRRARRPHGRPGAGRRTCRWSMRTWWAGRTRWCSTAPRSP